MAALEVAGDLSMKTAMRLMSFMAAAGLGLTALGSSAATSPASAYVQVQHNVPGTIAQAKYLKAHNPNDTFTIVVALHNQNQAALQAYLSTSKYNTTFTA